MPKRDSEYMEKQRERIVSAALKEFAAQGFQRASMRDVARRVGVSVGTLYIHFRHKDDLFTGLIDRHQSAVPGLKTASLTELRALARRQWLKPVDANLRRMTAMTAHMDSEALTNKKVRRRLEALAESTLKIFDDSVAREPKLARLDPAKRRVLARRLMYWWTGVSYYRDNRLGSNSSALVPELEAGFDALIADALGE